jgi:hypothetical protein
MKWKAFARSEQEEQTGTLFVVESAEEVSLQSKYEPPFCPLFSHPSKRDMSARCRHFRLDRYTVCGKSIIDSNYWTMEVFYSGASGLCNPYEIIDRKTIQLFETFVFLLSIIS